MFISSPFLPWANSGNREREQEERERERAAMERESSSRTSRAAHRGRPAIPCSTRLRTAAHLWWNRSYMIRAEHTPAVRGRLFLPPLLLGGRAWSLGSRFSFLLSGLWLVLPSKGRLYAVPEARVERFGDVVRCARVCSVFEREPKGGDSKVSLRERGSLCSSVLGF